MGNSKSIHLCLNSFAKKQQVMRHCHFFFVSTDAKWKKCSPSYFSLLAQFFILPLYACMKNFRCEGGHSIAHLIFKTCVQRRKDHFRLFLNTNTQWKKQRCLSNWLQLTLIILWDTSVKSRIVQALKHYLSIYQRLFLMIMKNFRSMKC